MVGTHVEYRMRDNDRQSHLSILPTEVSAPLQFSRNFLMHAGNHSFRTHGHCSVSCLMASMEPGIAMQYQNFLCPFIFVPLLDFLNEDM
jgi:hypothetical protein